jgi:hypothetical protein
MKGNCHNRTESSIVLTRRGYRVVTTLALAVFLMVWGFAGWLENLGM